MEVSFGAQSWYFVHIWLVCFFARWDAWRMFGQAFYNIFDLIFVYLFFFCGIFFLFGVSCIYLREGIRYLFVFGIVFVVVCCLAKNKQFGERKKK